MRILQNLFHKITSLIRNHATKLLVREVKLEEQYKNSQRVNLPFSEKTVCTSETKYMNFSRESENLQAATYSLPNIYTVTLNKIIYCTEFDILLTNSRKIISNSVNTAVERDSKFIKNIYFNKTEKIPGICTVFRSIANGYYHQLIDNIPRIYLLNQPQYRDLEEIKLLYSKRLTKSEEFFLSKLLPNNVKLTLLNPDRNYSIENLIFPSFLTRRHAGYLPSEYLKFFLEKVTPQRQRKKVNRIFISRRATRKGRHILNEDELFDTLSKYGFKRYLLEEMSIEEQINLFHDSEYVIGSHGAGLSNLIFAEKVKVLELFPTKYVWSHFYFLAKSLGHTYQYCYGQETSKNSNFVVDVSAVSRLITDREISPSSLTK